MGDLECTGLPQADNIFMECMLSPTGPAMTRSDDFRPTSLPHIDQQQQFCSRLLPSFLRTFIIILNNGAHATLLASVFSPDDVYNR